MIRVSLPEMVEMVGMMLVECSLVILIFGPVGLLWVIGKCRPIIELIRKYG